MIPDKNMKQPTGWKRKFFLKTIRYYIAYLRVFRRGQIKYNLMTRQDRGYPDCKDCGECCKTCFCWNEKTKLCKIWNDPTPTCQDWPVSPLQLQKPGLDKSKCRYYWIEDKNGRCKVKK